MEAECIVPLSLSLFSYLCSSGYQADDFLTSTLTRPLDLRVYDDVLTFHTGICP